MRGLLPHAPPTVIHVRLDVANAATQFEDRSPYRQSRHHLFAHMMRTPPPVRSPSLRRAK